MIARTFSEWQNGLYRVTMTDCTILLLLVSGMRHRSRREPAIQADQLVGGSDAVLVIDDTAVPKKGKHSVGYPQ